ncbi:MAG: efflux RND transporter periplasmic adaptor subunit [Prosthecobacter sp.]|nr:efflux RND transporter periplasmic adaptor subunit [Prosthecobacter sp.]
MKSKRLIVIIAGMVVLAVAGIFWSSRPPPRAEEHQGHDAAHDMGEGTLHIAELAQERAALETALVERRELKHTLRAFGKIGYNETGLATITSRVEGYVENLFVNFTGVEVKKGDHLAEIYSPDLAVAQRELLLGRNDPADKTLLEAARTKLERWGLLPQQIDEFLREGKVTQRVTLMAPMGGTVTEKMVVQNSMVKPGDMLYKLANLDSVWLYLDVYEYELGMIRYGQEVAATTESYPGETFTGRVWFINPTLSEETRTVKVIVSLQNKDRKLKPGMFVSAQVEVPLLADGSAAPSGVEGRWSCPMHPQVLRDIAGPCPVCQMALVQIPGKAEPAKPAQVLAIPLTSVLDSGTRKLVHVEVSEDVYRPVEVKLGPRSGDFYPVLAGVKEGDRVVVRGNFLLDSQFQIAGLPSLFYPKGQAPSAGHSGHGGMAMPAAKDATAPPPPAAKATMPAGHKH